MWLILKLGNMEDADLVVDRMESVGVVCLFRLSVSGKIDRPCLFARY